VIAQSLNGPEPAKRHERQQQKDGLKTVKAGREAKHLLGVMQKPADQECGQSQQNATVRDIKSGIKPWSTLIEFPDAGENPFRCCSRPTPHRGGAVGFSALALGGGRGSLQCCDHTRRRGDDFFAAAFVGACTGPRWLWFYGSRPALGRYYVGCLGGLASRTICERRQFMFDC
jgi:hypothetical protein